MTSEPNIYIGECTVFSNDYNGKALTISMKGCALSTTHISMTLAPDQQRVLREYLMKDVIEELEQRKTNCDDVKTGLDISSDSYAQLNVASKAFEQSIQLIKNGVKKE